MIGVVVLLAIHGGIRCVGWTDYIFDLSWISQFTTGGHLDHSFRHLSGRIESIGRVLARLLTHETLV